MSSVFNPLDNPQQKNRPEGAKIGLKRLLRKYWFFCVPLGFALLAGLMMIYDMHWGPWAFSDSAAYISAARNLINGHGFSLPTPEGGYEALTLHQPLYSLVLAFFLLFDIHPFTTTTVLNVACISLTMFMLGAGSYYWTKSKLLALIFLSVLVITPAWIDTFDGAMSEPLFLFLTTAAFFAILLFFKLHKTWMLIFAGGLAGLSFLTRFIGIVSISFILILLVMIQTGTWRKKAASLFTFGTISILPFLIWLVVTRQTAAGGRQILVAIHFSQRLVDFISEFRASLITWLPIPSEWSGAVFLATLLVILIAFSVLAITTFSMWRVMHKSSKCRQQSMLPLASGLFCIVYTLFLFAAYACSNIPPDINSRTLIPLLPFAWLMMTSAILLLPAEKPGRWLGTTLLVMYSIFAIIILLPISHELLYDRHHNGLGYTSKYYQESTIRDAARSLPLDIPWITNDPAFLLLYFNKFPYDLTTLYPQLKQPNLRPFGLGSSPLDQIFQQEDAALLILQPQMENQLRKVVGDAAPDVISKFTAGLYKYADSYDGQIYFWQK